MSGIKDLIEAGKNGKALQELNNGAVIDESDVAAALNTANGALVRRILDKAASQGVVLTDEQRNAPVFGNAWLGNAVAQYDEKFAAAREREMIAAMEAEVAEIEARMAVVEAEIAARVAAKAAAEAREKAEAQAQIDAEKQATRDAQLDVTSVQTLADNYKAYLIEEKLRRQPDYKVTKDDMVSAIQNCVPRELEALIARAEEQGLALNNLAIKAAVQERQDPHIVILVSQAMNRQHERQQEIERIAEQVSAIEARVAIVEAQAAEGAVREAAATEGTAGQALINATHIDEAIASGNKDQFWSTLSAAATQAEAVLPTQEQMISAWNNPTLQAFIKQEGLVALQALAVGHPFAGAVMKLAVIIYDAERYVTAPAEAPEVPAPSPSPEPSAQGGVHIESAEPGLGIPLAANASVATPSASAGEGEEVAPAVAALVPATHVEQVEAQRAAAGGLFGYGYTVLGFGL